MARTITYQQAINEALAQEMERDPTVVLFGEDVSGGMGSPGEEDAWGGVLGVTKGLYPRFPDRVLDTPISESAYIGAAAGAAAAGLRPVAKLMFVDFLGVCFDQIFNQAAKFRYMFGGNARTPIVIRTMWGAGIRAASQHSQALHPIFTHIPGLKVVAPSTPYDAKGLLIQAIRDDDPVIFLEHKVLGSRRSCRRRVRRACNLSHRGCDLTGAPVVVDERSSRATRLTSSRRGSCGVRLPDRGAALMVPARPPAPSLRDDAAAKPQRGSVARVLRS